MVNGNIDQINFLDNKLKEFTISDDSSNKITLRPTISNMNQPSIIWKKITEDSVYYKESPEKISKYSKCFL